MDLHQSAETLENIIIQLVSIENVRITLIKQMYYWVHFGNKSNI